MLEKDEFIVSLMVGVIILLVLFGAFTFGF